MSNLVSQQIRLKNRIVGMPKESDFELVEVPLPEPAGRRGTRPKPLHIGRPVYARRHALR